MAISVVYRNLLTNTLGGGLESNMVVSQNRGDPNIDPKIL